MEIINSVNWVAFGVGYLAFIKVITTLRDVLDKTPLTDDNVWERACTVLAKLGAALITGKRPV
jgi:hypothetical protein